MIYGNVEIDVQQCLIQSGLMSECGREQRSKVNEKKPKKIK